MNDLLEQLHDIEGLDPITGWPLAIGWWMLIAIGFLLIGVAGYFLFSQLAFRRSWKNDTFQKLACLEKGLSDETARESVITLSEYLRRIALRRFPRQECAALVGTAWLKWLTAHDPKDFDWEKKGSLLIEVPYAPTVNSVSVNQVKDLIRAVKNWVR